VKNVGYTLVNWVLVVNTSTICGMVMPELTASANWFMYVTPGAASNATAKKRYKSVFTVEVKAIEALLLKKNDPFTDTRRL
jgi:hypothetical protein